MKTSRGMRAIAGFASVTLFATLLIATAAPQAAAQAPAAFTLTRTSWDVIGLKSNVANRNGWQDSTPRTFPVSRRVCNTSGGTVTDVTATFALGTGVDTEIRVPSGWPTTLSAGALAPGACRELTFGVLIGEGHSGHPKNLFGKTREYTVTVSGTGVAGASSTGKLYVERLVAQNRNSTLRVESSACTGSTCTILAGETYRFTLFSKSAPNGYEQTESFLTFPLDVFEVLDVQTRYSAPTGATATGIYGDGCGWQHDPSQATWRTCVGPAKYPGGKVGGTLMRTTYSVRAKTALTGAESGAIRAMIYDLSGSSYHYNADFATSPAAKTIDASTAADVSVTLTHTGAFTRGRPDSYNVAVRNDGPSTAGAPVTVVATLPADSGVTLAAAPGHFTGTGWACVRDSATQATCTHNAALASGASAPALALNVTVGAGAAASFTATAVASQSVSDPDLANNTATDVTTTAGEFEADLVALNTVTTTGRRGGTAAYSVTARNDGPMAVPGPLRLVYTLPDGASFPSAPTGTGWDCPVDGLVATCTRAAGLAAGEAAGLISVQASIGQAVADPMVTTATLSSFGGEPPADPVPANNVNVAASISVAEADLSIDKRNPGQFVITPAGAGSTNTGVFTLTVRNAGPDAAAASADAPIRVTDALPSELGFVSATGTGWSCANADGTLTCDRITPLPAGAQAPPITLTMTVPQGLAEGVVLNSASVDGPTLDPDADDDTSDDIALLVKQTDIGITMTGPNTVTAGSSGNPPGTTMEYVVTVTNHGPAAATNVYWQGLTPPGAGFQDVLIGASGNTVADYETVCSVPDPGLQGDITCAVGSLAANASAVYRLRLKAVSGQTATPVANTVSTFGDQVDTNAANDTASKQTSCTGCVLAPVVTIDSGDAAVNEHASTTRTYAFTASHSSGVASVTTSCGVAGVKTGGTLSGTVTDATRTGTVVCVFDDGFVQLGAPGTSVVSVTAVQGTSNSATGTRTVTVSNVAPTATLTAPERATVLRTFTLSLDAAADASGADTTAGFIYRFDCGGGFGDWSASASATCTAPGEAGTVNVAGQIRDKEEAVSAYTDSVEVVAPQPQLAITTPARTTAAGVSTSVITVQLQDADGQPQTAPMGGQLLHLSSSSLTPFFRTPADAALSPAQVTVPAGQHSVSFLYRDPTAGVPVIRVHDQENATPDTGTYADVTQAVTVTPGAADIQLSGLNENLLVGATRTLTARIVDGNGATVTSGPDATATVTFSKSAGAGAVTGLGAVAAVNGVATLEVTGSAAGPVSVGIAATLLSGAATDGPLSFTVVAPGVSVAPAQLEFPASPPGTAGQPLTVTVTNTGTSSLTVSGAVLTGANSADFTVVSETCTAAPIAPEGTCTYSVRFTPGAAGARAGSLDLSSNAGPVSVPLAGTGSAPGDGNRAPVISVAVAPDPPKTNDTLTATVTVSDPDSDPVSVSYVWRVNGVTMRTVSNTTALTDTYDLSLPRRGDVNNLITVTATASDGALSASAARTVRVANSAPTATPRSALVRAVSVEGTGATAIGLAGADVDDQTLHYVITTLPTQGALKVGDHTILPGELPYTVTRNEGGTDLFPSSVTYVPAPGGARTDSFKFRVDDTNPVTPLSSGEAVVSVGIFTDAPATSRTTDADETVDSGEPTLTDPVQAEVNARGAGLYVSIADAPTRDVAPPAAYSLLGVEQTLHIRQNDVNGVDAVADADAPFEVTFLLHAGLVPPGLSVDDIAITRNDVTVPECSAEPTRPLLNQPCVQSPRVVAGDVLRITVRTLNASNWNFAIPAAPDTAIVAAYQGATSAGAPNDPGAPNAPTAGTLSGFAFSSNDPLATFECRLTRAGGATSHGNWAACSSGATSYTITGAGHPDDLYTFEVRGVRGGVVDTTPARRDFVVDRSAVSVNVTSGPASPHPVTNASFSFQADKPGTTFGCLLRLQTAVAGGYLPCTSPDARAGLTPGGAYEFNVRGTDEAGNTGTASWLFTVAGGAPPAPPAPGDDPEDPDDPDEPDEPDAPGGPAVERIAGRDRVGTAAALAVRYFEPGLPVVYVARDDDFPDALTATPLAVRDGAPILLVSPGAIPDGTADALRTLRPDRIVVLGGTVAVHTAVEEQLGAFANSVGRIAGPDRYGTAAAIARVAYPDGAPVVFVATGERFADALPAGAAAARAGGPVLLVTSAHVPQVTRDELVRLGATRVVLIGGESTIPASVLAEIEAATGRPVERIAGATRYDTAAAVSAEFFPEPVRTALIATGEDFADALTAGPVGGKLGGPVLLVHPDDLGATVAEEIGRLRPAEVLLLGGEGAVSLDTEAAIRAATAAGDGSA